MTTKSTNPFGPHRPRIESLVASCEDYLRRVRLGISDSRHYVTEKATSLRDTAQLLVRAAHEAEWELRRCHEVIVVADEEDERYVFECVLPAGHNEAHTVEAEAPALAEADRSAEELATAAVTFADSVAWIRHRADAVDPGDLDGLRYELQAVRTALGRAASAIAELVPVSHHAGEEEE